MTKKLAAVLLAGALVLSLILAYFIPDGILFIAGVYWIFVIIINILYKKLNKKSLSKDLEEDLKVDELSEENDDDYVRENFAEGKFSLPVGGITFVGFLVVCYFFSSAVDPIDESVVQAVEEGFFDLMVRVFASLIGAIVISLDAISLSEIRQGLVPEKEQQR